MIDREPLGPEAFLIEYPSCYLAELATNQEGHSIPMGQLIPSDVIAKEVGCTYVQTMNNKGVRHQFYFDDRNCIHLIGHNEVGSPMLGVSWLDRYPIDAPRHAITIGKQWDSPLGITDIVTGVARPYTGGYHYSEVTRIGLNPPTAAGRLLLNLVQYGTRY